MKKLIASLILVTGLFVTNQLAAQNCAAPTVSGGAYKQNKYQIFVSNPDKHYVNVEWIHDGNSTPYKCVGTWDDKNERTIITITRNVNPGASYSGIKNGDIIRVYMHCGFPVTYAACFTDVDLSAPSQDLTVQFHGN